MSQNNAYDCNSVWETCPADILLMVFEKLDIKSLINCMDVNTFWRNLVGYYCEKDKLWKAMVQHSIDDVKFTEKNKLGWRDQFLAAQQWLNVSNVNVSLQHHYKVTDEIKNISVCKDDLIVVTDDTVKYFDVENFKVHQILKRSCLKYEETSSLIAELSATGQNIIYDPRTIIMFCGSDVLSLTNKLILENFDSESLKENVHMDISLFKVHLNSCYVIDTSNVLWMYTANANDWGLKFLAKYYGNPDSICSIHIHKKDVYVLLKRGDLFIVNTECKNLEKMFHFYEPLNSLDSEPLVFQPFILLIFAPKTDLREYIEVYAFDEEEYVLSMSRHGATCLLEHGHNLLLGYDDGKIEIYLTRKLSDDSLSSEGPELEFYLKTYLDKTNQVEQNLRINSLAIYEDNIGHHLFVSTHSDVYELLLC